MSDRNDDIKVYQDKKTKAEDYKSSACTLLLVGMIGLAALVLMIAGVLPFRFGGAGGYITYGVMGTLFAVFIVMGILAFQASKRFAEEAVDEAALTEKIKAWAREQLTVDLINKGVWFEDGTSDEEKYFQYFEVIRTAIEQEFGSLNASYLEALCEELYASIFEKE